MDRDLLNIINYYGIKNQLKYIHSEYFELDEAILEYEKASEWTISMVENWNRHIAEEIADIMVMLKQFQYYYDISDTQIEFIMSKKIYRQLERIRNEQSK